MLALAGLSELNPKRAAAPTTTAARPARRLRERSNFISPPPCWKPPPGAVARTFAPNDHVRNETGVTPRAFGLVGLARDSAGGLGHRYRGGFAEGAEGGAGRALRFGVDGREAEAGVQHPTLTVDWRLSHVHRAREVHGDVAGFGRQ